MKFPLVLPVSTKSVESCFSLMKHVKIEFHNRMGDGYMNDSRICYIERESLQKVMQCFQKMKLRIEQL